MHLLRHDGLPWCGSTGEASALPDEATCVQCLWAVMRLAREAEDRLKDIRDGLAKRPGNTAA